MILNLERIADYIADFIRTSVKEAGCQAGVIGVSGGVDSAITATLSVRSGIRTIMLAMPMTETDKKYLYRAKLLSNMLNNTENFFVYSIKDIFSSYIRVMPEINNDPLNQGNLRSRIRANLLYAKAREMNALVIGTGNLAEDFCLGYFTKYGDGAVDISPIGDLYKSEVFELGKFLGIPREILDAVPSAGLWDNQTDEEELGFTYAQTEDWHRNKALPSKIRIKIESMHKKNLHKMRMPPICKLRHLKEYIV